MIRIFIGLLLASAAIAAPSVTNIGTNAQPWAAGDAWVPLKTTNTVGAGDVLVAMNTSWSGQGAIPTDDNGTFVRAVYTLYTNDNAPVSSTISVQTNAFVGQHIFTPFGLSGSEDGRIIFLKLTGLSTSTTQPVDVGQNWNAVPYANGIPNPNKIESIIITSSNSVAQVGDQLLVIVGVDSDLSLTLPVWSTPSGWTLIDSNNDDDNLGYIVLSKIVTVAGAQSVTVTWTDQYCFVAAASMAVFRASASVVTGPAPKAQASRGSGRIFRR